MKNQNTLLTFILLVCSFIINAQVLVKDIIPGYQSPYSHTFCSNNGILFFSSDDRIYGDELWKSDGTAAGTMMVKDIRPGYYGGYNDMNAMVAMGGNVYFPANDSVHGTELWKSDGTSAGTSMVKDIRLNNIYGSVPHKLYVMNNILFFIADDGINGPELWKSDGTAAGTAMILDILPGIYGESSYNTSYFMEVNGFLYFESRIATNGNPQLWKTDGTSSGTVFVKEISGSKLEYLTAFNGKLYFSTADNSSGKEIYVSDGSNAGTFLLKDVNPGVSGSYPANLTVFNGNLYFIASTAIEGRELWMTDGTSSGTVLVKDINAGTGDMNSPDSKLVAGTGSLFFFAYTAAAGSELWKTDGSSAGTILVKDVNPGTNPGTDLNYANAIIQMNGLIYFSGNNGTKGAELWKSDGTAAGTIMVKDIMPPGFTISSSSYPDMLYNHGGILYFTADDGVTGRELWKFDPAAIGIEEINLDNLSVHVFPNPTNNVITISSDSEEFIKAALIDISGRQILEKDITGSKSFQISLNDVSPGIYFLQLNNEKFIGYKKIIKH